MRVWWEGWERIVIGWMSSSRRLRGQMLYSGRFNRSCGYLHGVMVVFSAGMSVSVVTALFPGLDLARAMERKGGYSKMLS